VSYILWDSSGLGKRYVKENGEEVVNALFSLNVPMASILMVYLEVASIIRRHRNHGLIDETQFTNARTYLRNEILLNSDTTLLEMDETGMMASIPLGDRHNLNATDAIILYLFREFARETGERCFIVSSDLRLLRAANAEGLTPLNPETTAVADLAHYAW
jgi:predicted nucleic acid-binding protein